MATQIKFKVIGKAKEIHDVVGRHDRYYYDVETGGQTRLLSVGPKIHAIIKLSLPECNEFIITRTRVETTISPINVVNFQI